MKATSTSTSPQEISQAKPRLSISWPHVVLACIGIGLSLYARKLHAVVKAGGEGCGITETISCDKVLGSSYGEFYGIPLGLLGLVFFAIILILSFSTRADATTMRQNALYLLGASTVGLLTSLALTYISAVKIGAYCPICMATHATTLLTFLASVRAYFVTRRLS